MALNMQPTHFVLTLAFGLKYRVTCGAVHSFFEFLAKRRWKYYSDNENVLSQMKDERFHKELMLG